MKKSKSTPPLRRIGIFALGLLICAQQGYAGRYEELKRRISSHPHMALAAATFLGGEQEDELVGAVELQDGRILVAGNTRNQQGKWIPFLQAYTPMLDRIMGRIEYPPNSIRFTAASLTADQRSLYLCAEVLPDFRQLRPKLGRVSGEGNQVLLAMDPSTGRVAWATQFEMGISPRRIWSDEKGAVYVTSHRKGRAEIAGVQRDGKLRFVHGQGASNRGGYLTTNPEGTLLLYGSDRNTHTGREPWRQPYMHIMETASLEGSGPNILHRFWQWQPNKQIRGDGKDGAYKLESDSSILAAAYGKQGKELFVAAWSDGGNSVLFRQPDDLDGKWPSSSLGISTWGMKGASSISWLLRLDPKTYEVRGGTQWVGFIPVGFQGGKGNWPNAARIHNLVLLTNGSPVISGESATGLVPTPNAFWVRPEGMQGKYRGRYLTVFSPDLHQIHFSSYLPGYTSHQVVPLKKGLLIVGTTKEDDGREEVGATPPVTPGAVQSLFGGGETDGHLIRLHWE